MWTLRDPPVSRGIAYFRFQVLIAFSGAVGLLASVSCGGGGGDSTAPPKTPQPKPVTRVEISPSADTLTAVGATLQFQAVAKAADGSTISGKTFAWSSTNTSVVTVNPSTGLALASGNGVTTIRAIVDGVQGSASLTVNQVGSALVIRTQPSGAGAGATFTTQPQLEVRDARGNIAENDSTTVVTATIASGGGTLMGSTSAAAVGGVVGYTDLAIGGTAGNKTLTFTAQGIAGVTSASFTLAPGPAVQMALDAGDAQTGLAGTILPVSMSVQVVDAFGNAVSAQGVDWNTTAGSGTLSVTTTTTNAFGIAGVTYTLGRFAGQETVEATASGLNGSPIIFNVTATPNGTIRGVVTVASAFLAPSAAMATGEATKSSSAISIAGAPVRPSTVRQNLGSFQQPRSQQPQRPAPEYVPNELIVTFRPGPVGAPRAGTGLMSTANAQAVSSGIRTSLAPYVASSTMAVTGVSPAIRAARIVVPSSASLDAVATMLRNDPTVETVERNAIVRLDATSGKNTLAPPLPTLPNDPLYPWQAWNYEMIDAPKAWSITTGNAGVLVAVVDAGIRFDHTGIAANLANDGYDFVSTGTLQICGGGTIDRSGDGDGFDSDPTNPLDVNFDGSLNCVTTTQASGNHGLHVAGTIGAVGNDAAGGSGVSWSVRIRPVRVLDITGAGNNFDIAQGILYAAGLVVDDGFGNMIQAPSGAPIINMSLGGPVNSTMWQSAVTSATAAGSLIIAAAGNDGNSDPQYPAAYSETVSVSSVGPDALISSFSSFGSTIDIAAPGGDLVDGDATFGILSTAWNYVTGTPIWDAAVWNGTSMAAPHVSGVAALLLAQDPTLTATQLRSRLLNFAVDVGAPGRDDLYGNGIVNARNSLTQTLSPPMDLHVVLVDATSGAAVQTLMAAPDGSYAFDELADGGYYMYAGQDDNGDGLVGIFERRWGAFGGSATPTQVTINGAGTSNADFSVGFPIEAEPNNLFADADVLQLGGYLFGVIADINTPDVSRVEIPVAGTYTFETAAPAGACLFALGEDTVLQLYDGTGVLLVENDNVDAASNNFCSRITRSLTAGSYFVAVWGRQGSPRRYQVRARSGQ